MAESACTCLLLFAAALPAQVDRLELGLRLRAFERELARVTDPARRDPAMVEMNLAVQSFFRLDTKAVVQAIDRANFALRTEPPDADERHAHTLQLALTSRLIDRASPAATAELRAAYTIDEEPPGDLVLQIAAAQHPAWAPVSVRIGELPQTIELPLRDLPAGDHELRWSISRGDRELVARTTALSIVDDLQARLAAVTPDGDREAKPTIESATLRAHARTLLGMTRRRAEETPLPGAVLLAEAEALAKLPADSHWFDATRTGQFWLRVPVGSRTMAVRLAVPADAGNGERCPLVVALHGAGGSENLFFDGYGDGEIVRLCTARGWLLVAPRVEAFAGSDVFALVDALAARYPIDKSKVLLVGHSMGAAQVIAAAVRSPRRVAAIAPLGGGGNARGAKGLAGLPAFVGVGTRDFARSAARSLATALESAGAASQLREYEGVEHFAIVQLALPDVFAFFDTTLAATPRK
ncbi:MAG: dienelactone hydrolase family protein [Planctomycetes bacterium]|nr:dienelactone hydrolase family protein [Planctomycetota bacterium]